MRRTRTRNKSRGELCPHSFEPSSPVSYYRRPRNAQHANESNRVLSMALRPQPSPSASIEAREMAIQERRPKSEPSVVHIASTRTLPHQNESHSCSPTLSLATSPTWREDKKRWVGRRGGRDGMRRSYGVRGAMKIKQEPCIDNVGKDVYACMRVWRVCVHVCVCVYVEEGREGREREGMKEGGRRSIAERNDKKTAPRTWGRSLLVPCDDGSGGQPQLCGL